jgi:hypothetical protein
MTKQPNPSRKRDAAQKQLHCVAHRELLQKEEKRTSQVPRKRQVVMKMMRRLTLTMIV